MTYKTIVVYDDEGQLDRLVNAALAEGWQLQGGMSAAAYYEPSPEHSYGNARFLFAQAMTKVVDASS